MNLSKKQKTILAVTAALTVLCILGAVLTIILVSGNRNNNTAVPDETTRPAIRFTDPVQGAIAGYLVDKDTVAFDEDARITAGMIASADILFQDAETGEPVEAEVTVYPDGYFEAILPEGDYTMTVRTDGYAPYTWPQHISVLHEQVLELPDPIGLTAAETLRYEMRELDLEHYSTDGVLVNTNYIKYPFFLGNSEAEKKLNTEIDTLIAERKNVTAKEMDDTYNFVKEQGNLTYLPYSADDYIEVTYSKNSFVSLRWETVTWSGGAHPYHDFSCRTLEISTGEEKDYAYFLLGAPTDVEFLLDQTLQNALDTRITDTGWMKNTPFILTDKGLQFLYFNGSGVDPLEVTVPFTEGIEPLIQVPKQTEEGNDGFLTKKDLEELFIDANTFHVKWLTCLYSGTEKIETDEGTFYSLPNNEFATVEELREAAGKYFSEEVYDDYIRYRYRTVNGRLYMAEYGAGDEPIPIKYELEIDSQTSTECRFTIHEEFHDFNFESVESHSIPYVLKKTNEGNWIFTGVFNETQYLVRDENGNTEYSFSD